jgi:hypothetical protein
MPFTEDLSVFFNVADFATAAAYLVAGAPDDAEPATVNGVFDNAFEMVMGSVEDSGPRFLCRQADVPGVTHGATLTIGTTMYQVVGVQPDGTGTVQLRLARKS